jgi:hypothetical protein
MSCRAARTMQLAFTLAVSLSACMPDRRAEVTGQTATRPDDPPSEQTSAAVTAPQVARGRRTGAPCVASDGWQPPEVPALVAAGGGMPTAVSIDDSNRPQTFEEQPSGTLICVENPRYPKGYLSSRCRSSSECESGSVCDHSGFCLALCETDEDCAKPTRCTSSLGSPKHCHWPEAPGLLERRRIGNQPLGNQEIGSQATSVIHATVSSVQVR